MLNPFFIFFYLSNIFIRLIFYAFFSSVFLVVIFKYLPIHYTPLMLIRHFEFSDNKNIKFKKKWVPLEDISISMQKAVIASEDPKFFIHHGFDYEAIVKALERNKIRKKKLGASTISQQTAKNLFLYPSRTYVRKILELYFTILIEVFWDKKRILEVYLNIIELGEHVYGVEAASQFYCKKNAKKLSLSESTSFAAILPNPRKWKPHQPSNYILQRKYQILENMRTLPWGYLYQLDF